MEGYSIACGKVGLTENSHSHQTHSPRATARASFSNPCKPEADCFFSHCPRRKSATKKRLKVTIGYFRPWRHLLWIPDAKFKCLIEIKYLGISR